jgi:hypothetical protein
MLVGSVWADIVADYYRSAPSRQPAIGLSFSRGDNSNIGAKGLGQWRLIRRSAFPFLPTSCFLCLAARPVEFCVHPVCGASPHQHQESKLRFGLPTHRPPTWPVTPLVIGAGQHANVCPHCRQSCSYGLHARLRTAAPRAGCRQAVPSARTARAHAPPFEA